MLVCVCVCVSLNVIFIYIYKICFVCFMLFFSLRQLCRIGFCVVEEIARRNGGNDDLP